MRSIRAHVLCHLDLWSCLLGFLLTYKIPSWSPRLSPLGTKKKTNYASKVGRGGPTKRLADRFIEWIEWALDRPNLSSSSLEPWGDPQTFDLISRFAKLSETMLSATGFKMNLNPTPLLWTSMYLAKTRDLQSHGDKMRGKEYPATGLGY